MKSVASGICLRFRSLTGLVPTASLQLYGKVRRWDMLEIPLAHSVRGGMVWGEDTINNILCRDTIDMLNGNDRLKLFYDIHCNI